MGYADNMRQLLRPLGLYKLEESYVSKELELIGARLDEVETAADEAEKEAFLATAETVGLDKWEELFPYRPIASDIEMRRMAVAALMRIDGRSFTLQALNDTVAGCGYNAAVSEGEGMTVVVSFPDVMGVPDNFDLASERIESILPCHLAVEYYFRYPTFGQLDDAALTWTAFDAMALDWHGLEALEL